MQFDNSSYTVTAPDLLLADYGINVLIISSNEELTNSVQSLFEKYIQSSIVFNLQNTKTTEISLAWLYYVSRSVEFVICDLDTCEWIDVCTILTKEQDEGKFIVFYGGLTKKREAIRLLSALGTYFLIDDYQSLDNLIRKEIINPVADL